MIFHWFLRIRFFLQTTVLAVIFSLVFPFLSWALTPVWPKERIPSAPVITHAGQVLAIPQEMGTIQAGVQGQARTVICIDDLHCHAEVQNNIAAILAQVQKKYGLSLIGEEGAAGALRLDVLRDFPLVREREQVTDYFVTQGRLTGAEKFAATCDQPMDLFGIEDADLYAESYALVRSLVNAESQGLCLDLRARLDELKPRLYSPALQDLDCQTQAFLEGRLDQAHYSQNLIRHSQAMGLDVAEYPHVRQWAQAREGRTAAVSETLAGECLRLGRAIRTRYSTRPEERYLAELDDRLSIIEKLLNIAVTPEELHAFRANPEQFRAKIFIQFIRQQATEQATEADLDFLALDAWVQKAERFYRLADERSVRFVANLLSRMKEKNASLAVLVNGGFHRQAVIEELKRHGVGFISVAPRLTQIQVVNPYFSILQGQRLPIEKLLDRNQTILSTPAWPSAPEFERVLGSLFHFLSLTPGKPLPQPMQAKLEAYMRRYQAIAIKPLGAEAARRIFASPALPDAWQYGLIEVAKGLARPVVRIPGRAFSFGRQPTCPAGAERIPLPDGWVMILADVASARQFFHHETAWVRDWAWQSRRLLERVKLWGDRLWSDGSDPAGFLRLWGLTSLVLLATHQPWFALAGAALLLFFPRHPVHGALARGALATGMGQWSASGWDPWPLRSMAMDQDARAGTNQATDKEVRRLATWLATGFAESAEFFQAMGLHGRYALNVELDRWREWAGLLNDGTVLGRQRQARLEAFIEAVENYYPVHATLAQMRQAHEQGRHLPLQKMGWASPEAFYHEQKTALLRVVRCVEQLNQSDWRPHGLMVQVFDAAHGLGLNVMAIAQQETLEVSLPNRVKRLQVPVLIYEQLDHTPRMPLRGLCLNQRIVIDRSELVRWQQALFAMQSGASWIGLASASDYAQEVASRIGQGEISEDLAEPLLNYHEALSKVRFGHYGQQLYRRLGLGRLSSDKVFQGLLEMTLRHEVSHYADEKMGVVQGSSEALEESVVLISPADQQKSECHARLAEMRYRGPELPTAHVSLLQLFEELATTDPLDRGPYWLGLRETFSRLLAAAQQTALAGAVERLASSHEGTLTRMRPGEEVEILCAAYESLAGNQALDRLAEIAWSQRQAELGMESGSFSVWRGRAVENAEIQRLLQQRQSAATLQQQLAASLYAMSLQSDSPTKHKRQMSQLAEALSLLATISGPSALYLTKGILLMLRDDFGEDGLNLYREALRILLDKSRETDIAQAYVRGLLLDLHPDKTSRSAGLDPWEAIGQETLAAVDSPARPSAAMRLAVPVEIGFAFHSDPMQRQGQITAIVREIEKELRAPGKGRLPTYALLSDFHGGLDRFSQLLSEALQELCGFTGSLDSERSIAEQLEEQGISLHDMRGGLVFDGDALDRGEQGIQIIMYIDELQRLAPDRVFYVMGNHDLYAWANLSQFHLPSEPDYPLYGDQEAEVLLSQHRNSEPEKVNDPHWWAARLAEEKKNQDAYQASALAGHAKAVREKFKSYYRKYRRHWDSSQERAYFDVWEKLIGHFARIQVENPSVGLNGIAKTSVEWWEDVQAGLQAGLAARRQMDPRADDPATPDELAAWREAVALTHTIIQDLKARRRTASQAGRWWVRIIEAINRQAYVSPEWLAKDWSEHKNWGDAGFAEINRHGWDKDQVDAANYLQSPTLQALKRFFDRNLNHAFRDVYANLTTHSWLPFGPDGSLRLRYRQKEYSGAETLDLLEILSRDMSDPDLPLAQKREAVQLVLGWYGDFSSQNKPVHIADLMQSHGVAKLQQSLGAMIHSTGHNPQTGLAKRDIPPLSTELDADGFLYIHAELDGGMAPQYGHLGRVTFIGPAGAYQRGFEQSHSTQSVDSPAARVTDSHGAVVKRLPNQAIPSIEFLQHTRQHLLRELRGLRHGPGGRTPRPGLRGLWGWPALWMWLIAVLNPASAAQPERLRRLIDLPGIREAYQAPGANRTLESILSRHPIGQAVYPLIQGVDWKKIKLENIRVRWGAKTEVAFTADKTRPHSADRTGRTGRLVIVTLPFFMRFWLTSRFGIGWLEFRERGFKFPGWPWILRHSGWPRFNLLRVNSVWLIGLAFSLSRPWQGSGIKPQERPRIQPRPRWRHVLTSA